MNPKVDAFLERAPQWRDEMERLRSIVLDCGLDEELKWGKPCYTIGRDNVAIIQPFRDDCAFMFFKGALLYDPEGILEQPGPNSHAARRIRFSSTGEVAELEPHLRRFIAEAIDAEKAGLTVEERGGPESIPEELQQEFGEVEGLKASFEALTPGRQRAYLLHFAGAKQSKTRTSRIERCIPRILEGRGLNE